MHQNFKALILSGLLMITAGTAIGQSPLVAALDAMYSAMDTFAGHYGQSPGWGRGVARPGMAEDFAVLYREMPGGVPRSQSSQTSLLDGVWMGQRGELFMIRDGFFRLFVNGVTQFENGRMQLQGGVMQLKSGKTEQLSTFQYSYLNGRMVLKSEEGRVLLYKRLPFRWIGLPETGFDAEE